MKPQQKKSHKHYANAIIKYNAKETCISTNLNMIFFKQNNFIIYSII